MTPYEQYKNQSLIFKIVDKDLLDTVELFSHVAYMQGLTDAFDRIYNLPNDEVKEALWKFIILNTKPLPKEEFETRFANGVKLDDT